MNARTLMCFAHGRGDRWEALCVDFDIAVQGSSQHEVEQLMDVAIRSYVRSLADEEPAVRERLLGRRTPWHVSAKLALTFLWHALSRRDRGETRIGIHMPCPV